MKTEVLEEIEAKLLEIVKAFTEADSVVAEIDPQESPQAFDAAWKVRMDALDQVGIHARVWARQKSALKGQGK